MDILGNEAMRGVNYRSLEMLFHIAHERRRVAKYEFKVLFVSCVCVCVCVCVQVWCSFARTCLCRVHATAPVYFGA